MASGSGPWLLAVAALVAAWISDVATAWPSSEQAGTSQKSISCLPCSRTYVADAYLDTLRGQLAQHRDLTEISYSADLCKGLADDLDVPMLSDLHRQLVGEGSHRRFLYSVKFGNCQDYMVNFLDGYDANLVIIEKLPNGVFADPFELQHFVEQKVFLDVAVFGDTNLEIPSALSNWSAVEIHFDLRPSTSMNCNLAIELPLHARYLGKLVDGPGRQEITKGEKCGKKGFMAVPMFPTLPFSCSVSLQTCLKCTWCYEKIASFPSLSFLLICFGSWMYTSVGQTSNLRF